jgi:uncharacterized protein (DUF433 family)
MTIRQDEEILGREPRISGTRIGVRHAADLIVSGAASPAQVADQLGVSLAEIYDALSYYYDHAAEIRDYERENERAHEKLQKRGLKPKDPA